MRLVPGVLFCCCALLGAEPADLAIVEKVWGKVSFYSAAGKRIGEVKVGQFPHEAVLSSDGRTLYVSNNGVLWMTDLEADGENSIAVIDVPGRKLLRTISLGQYRRPHGLSLDSSGRLWSTTEKPDRIVRIDPKTGQILDVFDPRGQNPHMVAWSEKLGKAYGSNSDSGSVAVIDPGEHKVKLIGGMNRPQGGVFSGDAARFYVTNSNGNDIAIIDTARHSVIGRIPTGKGPGRIALSPDGRTAIYNLGTDDAVGFADVQSRKETHVVPIGGRPLSLTLSADGSRAYAGIQDQDKVVVLSVPDRKVIQTIELPKGSGPDPVIPLR